MWTLKHRNSWGASPGDSTGRSLDSSGPTCVEAAAGVSKSYQAQNATSPAA
jgi:hypothetical protein